MTEEIDPPYITKTGRVLTDADLQALADEAEQGYDVERLREGVVKVPKTPRVRGEVIDVLKAAMENAVAMLRMDQDLIDGLEAQILERDSTILQREQEIMIRDREISDLMIELSETRERHERVVHEKDNTIAFDQLEINRLKMQAKRWWK